MRALLPFALAVPLLVSGCTLFCPQPATIRMVTLRDSPRAAFETFRTALAAGAADVVHESFSPAFKEKYGVPGLRTFKLGFSTYRSDFDELARVLANAESTGVRYGAWEDRRLAVLTLEAGDASGEFVLVDIPTWSVTVEFEGYPEPSRSTYFIPGTGFEEILAVREGKIYVGPLDATDTGVVDPAEVLSLSVGHEWYLLDIQRLVNVKPLLDRLRAADAAGAAGAVQ